MDECKIMRDELLADMDFDLNEYDREQFEKMVALILKQGNLRKFILFVNWLKMMGHQREFRIIGRQE